MEATTCLISLQDVIQCVDIEDAIQATEAAFRECGEGGVILPTKISLDMTPLGIPHWINAMPAYVDSVKMAGLKWIGGFAANSSSERLPYIMGVLILTDPATGIPLAIMEAAQITALRTGASCAVAAKYLARPDASIVAIFGAGTQGTLSLDALSRLFPLEQARVVDVSQEKSQRFAREMSDQLSINVSPALDPQSAVEGADIIVTATNANEPLVLHHWVKPGAVVLTLGSFQEIDDRLVMGSDLLVTDSREQSKHRGQLAHLFEAGLIADAAVHAEMGEIVAGTFKMPSGENHRVVACLTGIAAHDITLAALIYRRAQELGLGGTFDFLKH